MPTTPTRKSGDPPAVLHIEEEVSDVERAQIRLLKQLLTSYHEISQHNVRENVTKAVMYFLVTKSMDVLHKELVTGLYKEELFSELLKEDEGIVARRQEAIHRLDVLKKSEKSSPIH